MEADGSTPKPAQPGAEAPQASAQLTRLALEAGPLIVFFVTNSFYGIMVGTACFMVATLVSLALSLRLEGRVPIMPLVGCVFVLAFGGLTLLLDNDLFIKIKPTVVNLLFAGILFAGLAMRRNLLKLLMGSVLNLTERGWQLLTLRWACFFVFLAGLNEVVWRSFSTDTWVSFKLFGILPLSLAFALAQVPLIHRYQHPEQSGTD